MSNLLESYRVLGIKVGAGMADVTTSYRQLCRRYHPDVTDDPTAEEHMKQINIAYTVLREKFKRENAFSQRQPYSRTVRRYPPVETRQQNQTPAQESAERNQNAQQQAAEAYRQKAAEQAVSRESAEKEAYAVLHNYFAQLNSFDYAGAYGFLSDHDKKHISAESFILWRESVARLYPMREFKIASGSSVAVITWGDKKTFHARKFRVIITEEDYSDDAAQSGDVDKLVINENGRWGVFLGYKEINELTRLFDRRYEKKKKQDIGRLLDEYRAGLHSEYNMLNMEGMKKSAAKELYRQRRYGGAMTFAVISISHSVTNSSEAKHSRTTQKGTNQSGVLTAGQEEFRRSAAKTICGMLRETDIPAYAGDGVFAILFVELGRKNAENIIKRLVEAIRKNAGSNLSANSKINYGYDSWSSNIYADMDTLNNTLKKFGKKV